MIDREDYLIVSKKETLSLQRIALAVQASEHPITVYSEEREMFLKFFFRLWREKKKEYNMSGLRNLAEYLCGFVDFRSAENDNTSVGSLTIEKELFSLREKFR